jgi:hypothetical protein
VRQWWVSLDENTPTINARAYALLKAILNTAVADEELVATPVASDQRQSHLERETSGPRPSRSWRPSAPHFQRTVGR